MQKTVSQTSPDYKVFKKSKEEKAELQTLKAKWKKDMKVFYGQQWRKHNNCSL